MGVAIEGGICGHVSCDGNQEGSPTSFLFPMLSDFAEFSCHRHT